jgi:hypothetical protein
MSDDDRNAAARRRLEELLLLAPAPCASCARAPRCAAELLVCSAFVAYTERRPHWQILPRVDASHERYIAVMRAPSNLAVKVT